MHFLCLEPRETDKNVLKFSKNWVLKFHLLLRALKAVAVLGQDRGAGTDPSNLAQAPQIFNWFYSNFA